MDVNNNYFYFTVSVCTFGFILNFIKIVVFSRQRLNRNTNIGSMHALLSVFNMFALANTLILDNLLPYMSVYPRENSAILCKLFNFLPTFASSLPAFQLVWISTLFYLSIKRQIVYARIQRLKILAPVTCVLVVLAGVANSYNFLHELRTAQDIEHSYAYVDYEDLHELNKKYICYSSLILTAIGDSINVSIRFFMPMLIIGCLNVSLFVHMHHNNGRGKPLDILNSIKKKHRPFILAIISMNILYFALYLPWFIAHILVYYSFFSKTINEHIILFYNYSWSISYLNYVLPFFIHVSLNRLFKTELVSMIPCCYISIKINK